MTPDQQRNHTHFSMTNSSPQSWPWMQPPQNHGGFTDPNCNNPSCHIFRRTHNKIFYEKNPKVDLVPQPLRKKTNMYIYIYKDRTTKRKGISLSVFQPSIFRAKVAVSGEKLQRNHEPLVVGKKLTSDASTST